MSEPTFDFFFCDDVRHEMGGKVSLMGVCGPAVNFADNNGTLAVTSVVIVGSRFGEEFEVPSIELGIQVDDQPETYHAFAPLPTDSNSPKKKPNALAALESAVPGLEVPARLLGVLRVEGLKFKRYCDLKAYVDRNLRGRVTFFKTPASDGSQTEQKPKKSSPTSPRTRRSAPSK